MKKFQFKAGLNDGVFVVDSLDVEIPFSIYFLSKNSRLVVTDIDGTITESDIKGFVFPQLGLEAHQVNQGNLTEGRGSLQLTSLY